MIDASLLLTKALLLKPEEDRLTTLALFPCEAVALTDRLSARRPALDTNDPATM